jgi:hypothetical protein
VDARASLEDVPSVAFGSESGSDDEGESSSGASDEDDDDAEEEGVAPPETVHTHQGPENDVAQNDPTAGQIKLTSAFKRVVRHHKQRRESKQPHASI